MRWQSHQEPGLFRLQVNCMMLALKTVRQSLPVA